MGQICEAHPEPIQSQFPHLSPPEYSKSMGNHPSEAFATKISIIPELSEAVKKRKLELGQFKSLDHSSAKKGELLEPYKLRNGMIYIGEWKEGKIHGLGEYYLPDGSFLICTTNMNQIIGNGRIIHNNGDYYEGSLERNQANGPGKYVEKNITYRGQFENNVPHGQGTETTIDSEFKGDFFHGEKVKGRLYWREDGVFYEYNGEFLKDKFHGVGTLKNEIGTYDGSFMNGEKSGHGKFTWNDGHYYTGHYSRNMKNGQGKIYSQSHQLIKEGRWRDDQLI